MGMDGVSDLQAYQWIAELLAFGIATFCGICFMIGFIAGPEKVKPVGSNLKTNINDQDLFAVATGDEEYLAAHCTVGTKQQIQREKLQLQMMRNKIAKLKLEKQLSKLTESNTVAKTIDSALVNDCINSLVALGEKKTDAKKQVEKYFSTNPNTKTVDEFISGVFQK